MNQPNPELEKDLVEYQNAEKQLQMVMLQKHQLQLQLNEISLALEELAKAKSDIYKATGSIMMKTTREDAEKDLKDRKNLFEIRVKTLAQQEEKAKSQLLRLQKKIEDLSKGYTPSM
ncbi:MAG: prefoldin subunit beta [Candidatus Micrarchaeia archaeon]